MNRFTNKAQEAIQSAHSIAMENSQQQVDAVHLALALTEQEDGVVLAILKKIDTDIEKLKEKIIKIIKSLPKIKPEEIEGGLADLYVTQLFQKTIIKANKEARRLNDEYVSTEHLFLAILSIPSSVKDIFQD